MEFENGLVEFHNKQVASDSGCVNFYGGQIQKPHFSTRGFARSNKGFSPINGRVLSQNGRVAFKTGEWHSIRAFGLRPMFCGGKKRVILIAWHDSSTLVSNPFAALKNTRTHYGIQPRTHPRNRTRVWRLVLTMPVSPWILLGQIKSFNANVLLHIWDTRYSL